MLRLIGSTAYGELENERFQLGYDVIPVVKPVKRGGGGLLQAGFFAGRLVGR